MKKKIISIFLSCFIFVGSCFNSFANPLVAVPISISYEALVGLMTVGVAFGLSMPNSDEEYWDYTSSLKRHLQEVDDKYLSYLEKSVQDWKDKNFKKPDDEKEPLKIPYIPGLKNLFDKVGKEVSSKYSYLGTSVLNVPIYRKVEYSDYLSFAKSIPMYRISPSVIRDINTPYGTYSFRYTPWSDTSGIIHMSQDNFVTETAMCNLAPYDDIYVAVYLDTYSSYGGKTYLHFITYSPQGNKGAGVAITRKLEYQLSSTGSINKTQISYSPTDPNVEDDFIIVPTLPNVDIPNIETLPGYYEGIEPPFEVSPPYEPGTDSPGTDSPGTDSPGTDSPGTDSPGTDSPGNSEGLFPDKPTLTDYIKSLIVPSDSFWTDTFNEFRTNLGKNFPMLDMSKFDSLLVEGKPFPNIYAYGSKVVDGDIINSIVDWLRPIIAGFIMICLMFFNYRKVYKIIRNSEPFGNIAPGTSDFSTGLSSADIKQIVADAKRETERRTYRK